MNRIALPTLPALAAAWLALAIPAVLCAESKSRAPYPPSKVIPSVAWDFQSLSRAAPGSDLWPIAWADDGRLYTSWGDGGGFGGTNSLGRVSLGVARIEGPPERFQAVNLWGGFRAEAPATFAGKSNGILAVDGALYLAVVEQGKWLRARISRSNDHGRTWQFNSNGWDFAESDGAFSDIAFLTFGKDYQGARDGYVYAYSQDQRAHAVGAQMKTFSASMFRTPKDRIMDRAAYEFFAGLDERGQPRWTKEIAQRKPVFADPAGVGWGVRVCHHPVLRRYLLTAWHDESGGWGLFDAPEPWGPWSTVAYKERWIDDAFKFGFTFNQKWMSGDGKTLWMVFSGLGKYDSFNLIRGTLVLSPESRLSTSKGDRPERREGPPE